MDNFFSNDNVLFKLLRRICDIFMLHLLWVICSLPIFTIGASTTALYYTAMKNIQVDDGYVSRRFFKSFKENFKQSTIIWLILLAVGVIFSGDMMFAIKNKDTSYGKPLMFIFTVLICIYVFITLYVWPLQAKFKNEIKTTFRNAFLLSIKYFPWTLLLILIIGFVAFCIYLVPIFGVYVILMGASSYALVTSFIFLHIFKPYLPKERDYKDEEFNTEYSDKITAETIAKKEEENAITKTDNVTKAPKKDDKAEQKPASNKGSISAKANAVSNLNPKKSNGRNNQNK